MIAHLRIDEVLLPPFQVDELLLGGQVEVEEPLDELRALQGLQPGRVDQVALAELQDHGPIPLAPVLDAEDPRRFDFVLVLLLVDIVIVLVLEVDLVVRYNLVVGQADFRIDEELIAVHEEGREVARAERLPGPQDLVLRRVLQRVPQGDRRELLHELGRAGSRHGCVLVLREVGGKLDQRGELWHLGEQIGRQVDDLLEEALALDIQVAAFFRGGAEARQGVVGARVVAGLEEQRDVVVQ